MQKNYFAHVANKAFPPRARLIFKAKDVVYVHVCSALFNRYIYMRLSFVLVFVNHNQLHLRHFALRMRADVL